MRATDTSENNRVFGPRILVTLPFRESCIITFCDYPSYAAMFDDVRAICSLEKSKSMLPTTEVNFDGIVGPTHNYAGLSYGNIASVANQNQIANPQFAALQGLEKMAMVQRLGVEQAVLPPQLRPQLSFLRACGFQGSPKELIQTAAKKDKVLLAAANSAACMWTANAATVSPSVDCRDKKLHITPANLTSGIHRSIEADQTKKILKAIFYDPSAPDTTQQPVIHSPLGPAAALSDEGAANHMRLTPCHSDHAIEVFVFGRNALNANLAKPGKFPARQTLQAFQSISRKHHLANSHTFFLQQNPVAIDAGAFHNDVVAVANENVILCHQDAFYEQQSQLENLSKTFNEIYQNDLSVIEIKREQVPLKDAVASYLFNSQLVTLPNREMALIAPTECQNIASAASAIDQIIHSDNPINHVCYPDVRQSMNNGGGPACLRLRVVMNHNELSSMHQSVRLNETLYQKLVDWVTKHYRTKLTPDDLCDPKLYYESLDAMGELESILDFPPGTICGKNPT